MFQQLFLFLVFFFFFYFLCVVVVSWGVVYDPSDGTQDPLIIQLSSDSLPLNRQTTRFSKRSLWWPLKPVQLDGLLD